MHTPPLAWLALRSIALYQRHLSPRKGYRCALHAAGSGRSCSAYGYRAIVRSGVVNGMVLLRRRFDACARAGAAHSAATPAPAQHHRTGAVHQRGFCDLGCDAGDCGAIEALGDCLGDACSSACDWRWRRRKEDQPEAKPSLPPAS